MLVMLLYRLIKSSLVGEFLPIVVHDYAPICGLFDNQSYNFASVMFDVVISIPYHLLLATLTILPPPATLTLPLLSLHQHQKSRLLLVTMQTS